MNEQDNGSTSNTTRDDMFEMGRRLVADGAGLSNLAGRAVFARYDELDRAHADRLRELIATKDHARGLSAELEQTDAQLTRVQDLASRRLDHMRRLRAKLDGQRTPTPADIYGGDQSAERERRDPIGTALHEAIEGLFGKSGRNPFESLFGTSRPASDEDSITMSNPPRELLDVLFGEGNPVPDGVTVMPPFMVSVPRDGETDEDGVPNAIREHLTRIGAIDEGDKLVRVGDNAVAILSGSGSCSDPDCLACGAVRGLSERESAPQAAGDESEGSRLTGAQVRDLAPGTDFRLVEMEGKTIPPWVLPWVQRTFGPLVSASAVFALLTPEGMPVPAETDRRERATFEQIMRQLDERSARFEIVG